MPRRNVTLAGFFVLGAFWGAWAAVLPDVQEAVDASKGALGAALLFTSVGSVPAMFFLAAPAVRRFGARAVAVACGAFAVATTLPGLVTTLPVLMLTLVLTGAASGVFDVTINANAGRIEQQTGRRLMPAAHGTYSVGLLAGAVAAGFARSAGAGREPILLAISLCVAAVGVLALSDDAVVDADPPTPGFRLAHGLLLIGLVGAAAFVVEGGMESWSALFLERQLGAQPSVSGLGPGIFGASMAAGRFFAQAAGRLPDRVLLGGGGSLAAVGCLVAAAAPNAPLGIAGFALGGMGVSLNAPVVFGLAARRPEAAHAVATVTTLGYLGLLLGPPLVGGVAQVSSLRASFVVLALIGVVVAALAACSRAFRE